MNRQHVKLFLYFIIGLLLAFLAMYFLTGGTGSSPSRHSPGAVTEVASIAELTAEENVIAYLKQHKSLPKFYLTKGEARAAGWEPAAGNLCEILPGRAIGGDRFGNREKKLPPGPSYFEADLNYSCGKRGKDRLVYSEGGTIYVTTDHYRTFVRR